MGRNCNFEKCVMNVIVWSVLVYFLENCFLCAFSSNFENKNLQSQAKKEGRINLRVAFLSV